MNHTPQNDNAWRGIILLTCLAALYVAWVTVHNAEAAACRAISGR